MKNLKDGLDMKVLKDVFLHGTTHADMSRFLNVSKDVVVSYDKYSMIHLWKVNYTKWASATEIAYKSEDAFFFSYTEALEWYNRFASWLYDMMDKGIIYDYNVGCVRVY